MKYTWMIMYDEFWSRKDVYVECVMSFWLRQDVCLECVWWFEIHMTLQKNM